jgi:transcriptional regulator with XRE-family HTH domain
MINCQNIDGERLHVIGISAREHAAGEGQALITAAQLRAARALLGIDQRGLAELANLSVPTIQRMEASEGVVRGVVDSLMKLVDALDAAGVELIGEGATSQGGGRGVRLKQPATVAHNQSRKSSRTGRPRADVG